MSDGSSIRYGEKPFGGGGTTKRMPPGVLCEGIADFAAVKFKNEGPPALLESLLKGKGAAAQTTYKDFKIGVGKQAKSNGCFNWDAVHKVVLNSNQGFAQHGLTVFLCNRRMDGGPSGGGGGFAQWFEYVDLSVGDNQTYKPEENYDPSLNPAGSMGLACMLCTVM